MKCPAISGPQNDPLHSVIFVRSNKLFSFLEVKKMSEKKVLKRKKFDISFKLDAISRVKNGEKQCDVCRDLGINEATLPGWLRSESAIKGTTLQLDESEGLARKRLRLANDSNLDQALYHWFVQARADGAPISGPVVCAKATNLDKQLNGEDSTFKASSGWLMRWKKRHGIGCNAISGDIKSADNEAAEQYPTKLHEILDEGGYTEDQVYNCDETGLMFKMLPRKTLSVKRDPTKHEGVKEAKDRVTILLTVNKTGDHKLKPLCIGKFKNLRAFHHVNRKILPCVYDYSKNAWMTSLIFENWFHSEFVPAVRRHFLDKNLEPKALLLLDNCPAHPPCREPGQSVRENQGFLSTEEHYIKDSTPRPRNHCHHEVQLSSRTAHENHRRRDGDLRVFKEGQRQGSDLPRR